MLMRTYRNCLKLYQIMKKIIIFILPMRMYTKTVNLYNTLNQILNDLLKEFLKTSDLFNEKKLIKQYQDYDQIMVERKKYTALKTSFLQ